MKSLMSLPSCICVSPAGRDVMVNHRRHSSFVCSGQGVLYHLIYPGIFVLFSIDY